MSRKAHRGMHHKVGLGMRVGLGKEGVIVAFGCSVGALEGGWEAGADAWATAAPEGPALETSLPSAVHTMTSSWKPSMH